MTLSPYKSKNIRFVINGYFYSKIKLLQNNLSLIDYPNTNSHSYKYIINIKHKYTLNTMIGHTMYIIYNIKAIF